MKTLGVFDKTLAKTSAWIEEVAHELGSTDMERAYHVLKSVLHAVRDRLPPEQAVHLGAQMPMLVRGFYFEGWHPAKTPERYRHKEAFFERLAHDLPGLDPTQRERAASAVFSVLRQHVAEGEIRHVTQAMPSELRQLWEPAA